MARYSAFLGQTVDVLYRAGDICLPASGTFVGDSGRSIFLEHHYEQRGQAKNFRWEIPYPCVVRLEKSGVAAAEAGKLAAEAVKVPPLNKRSALAKAAHAGVAAATITRHTESN